MDAATLLASVEAAITALLTGGASSYSIGNRSVTKLDLAQLLEERRLLLTEVQRASGSGAFSLAKMGRRY
jgi:hypothetical protein